ncbi:MAG: restriction endonuclease subunit S [Pseudomonadota bacterium]|nr:restriction endonuclease subunit S [Pseudomonadota bacterium]
MLRVNNFQGHSLNLSEVMRLAPEIEAKYGRTRIQTGDVLLTIVGSVGQVAVVPDELSGWNIARAIAMIRPNKPELSRWISLVLRSPQAQYQLGVNANTTVQTTVNLKDLRELRIPLPDDDERDAIAHILGTLDDKIELNRRRNQTLEAMARALFKDWFVDFGPVRAKMAGREPYLPDDLWKLFPDRLDDEGKPEGWQSATLANFASLNPESWTKKSPPHEIRYVDLSNTKQGTIEGAARMPWSEAPSRAQRILRIGDTIVGTVRPGNKSFALIADEGMTGSTGFAVLRPLEKDFRDFVFLAATSPENIERLSHLADGAAYPAVRPDVVLASPVTVPSGEIVSDVLRGFANAVSGLVDAIEHNKRESRTLAQLRDTLLPKLISGELRIADAAKFLEATL